MTHTEGRIFSLCDHKFTSHTTSRDDDPRDDDDRYELSSPAESHVRNEKWKFVRCVLLRRRGM